MNRFAPSALLLLGQLSSELHASPRLADPDLLGNVLKADLAGVNFGLKKGLLPVLRNQLQFSISLAVTAKDESGTIEVKRFEMRAFESDPQLREKLGVLFDYSFLDAALEQQRN